MMSSETMSLPSIVFDFLLRIPQSVQKDILVFVVIYATHEEIGRDDDFLERMRRFLLEPKDGMTAISALICSVAALDHILPRAAMVSRSAEPALRSLVGKIPKLEATLLSLPLRQKYFDRVMTEWKALRAKIITAQTLRDFEDIALSSRFQKGGSNDEQPH